MTDLTDRMRTCASYIMANNNPADVHRDAAALLIEAADALDGPVVALPPAMGEPMAIIPPVEPAKTVPPVDNLGRDYLMPLAGSIDWHAPGGPSPVPPSEPSVWIAPGGPLPGLKQSGTTSARACPRCDSRGYKRVYRVSCQMMIACQVCGHSWEFGR